MRVSRAQILRVTEDAVREALRETIREALRNVSRENEVTSVIDAPPIEALAGAPSAVFDDVSDEEAWERFDSIRFVRYAGTSR